MVESRQGETITMSDISGMMVFAGNSTPKLSKEVAACLGIPLGNAEVGQFSDGEIRVEILDNVRGFDVFIIQSTCHPTNDNLMELLIIVDALRRSSAGRITAVIPYFGYARQDRRVRSARVPITAKVVANLLTVVGVDRVLTVDLHADQIQGFFDLPVDNIYGSRVMLDDITSGKESGEWTVVSPDVGGVVRARAFAKSLGDQLAIIDKRRPKPNVSKIMHIIGEVKDKQCLIVDDMVDTAGTLCEAAKALKNNGAAVVSAYITHAVLSGPAIDNISRSVLDELVVTDSIPLTPEAEACDKIRALSISPMLAESIRRINREESVSELFEDESS
jgi:ribose-phosphate pyrophosphokinase